MHCIDLQIGILIDKFRCSLQANSLTAQAIDRGASRARICEHAIQEGYRGFVNEMRALLAKGSNSREGAGRKALSVDGLQPLDESSQPGYLDKWDITYLA